MSLVYLSIGDVYTLINYASFVEALFIGLSIAGLLYLRYKFPDRERPIKVSLFKYYHGNLLKKPLVLINGQKLCKSVLTFSYKILEKLRGKYKNLITIHLICISSVCTKSGVLTTGMCLYSCLFYC